MPSPRPRPTPPLAAALFVAVAQASRAVPAGEVAPPPGYDFAIPDGLRATLLVPKLPHVATPRAGRRRVRVTGFRRPVPVRVAWQERPAPVVVVLRGLLMRRSDPVAQRWIADLHSGGCSVLTFDSPFSTSFLRRSGHGVPGNPEGDALAVGRVVRAFLDAPGVRDRVTAVSVLGGSYGGTLALNLCRLQSEGRSPVTFDRFLALSPPIRLETASRRLDSFFADDVRQQGRWRLLRLRLLGTRVQAERRRLSPGIMRAGLGFSFHRDLARRVRGLRALVGAGVLTDPAGVARLLDPKALTFTRYLAGIAGPDGRARLGASGPVDPWAAGDVGRLLAACGAGARVVLAADDPLNDPADLEALSGAAPSATLTVLPLGGHLGYADTGWCRRQVREAFAEAAAP